MTLGKRIAALRAQQNLRQEDLAECMGVSPQAVSKWENDLTCPDISLLPQLADTFGVTADYLLRGDDAPPAVRILPEAQRKPISEMMLRIIVDSADGDRVRVNLPLALMEAALELGLEMPQLAGSDALKSIDFAKLMQLVQQGAIGNLVEVDSADGDTVRIFVE